MDQPAAVWSFPSPRFGEPSYHMKITSDLFHAYLKCSTKCWLRATRGLVTENKYPEWVEAQNYSYRTTEVARLVAASPKSELVHSPNMKDVKTAKWRLASSLATRAAKQYKSTYE